jgi:anaerobic ribonucleoside-triphosphate reductase activating protein
VVGVGGAVPAARDAPAILQAIEKMKESTMLDLHAIWAHSRANGPGTRMVLWFQGCTLGCPGCFNPATHAPEPRWQVSVEEIMGRIMTEGRAIDGITLSGGEPLQQPEALLELLCAIRAQTNLSVLLFSGYTMAEIEHLPLGPAILTQVDVLIAGRYVQTKHLARGLRGSANKTVHLLTDRYILDDIDQVPEGEVWIEADGTVVISGIEPPFHS